MTGIKDYNYPEFNRVAADLRDYGCDIFNPAEIKLDNPTYEGYMEVCLEAIERCDKIYLLKGWECSSGAKRELKKALELGLEIRNGVSGPSDSSFIKSGSISKLKPPWSISSVVSSSCCMFGYLSPAYNKICWKKK